MNKFLLIFMLFLTSNQFLFSKNFNKGMIIESRDEISCPSFNSAKYVMNGIRESKGNNAFMRGWLRNVNCKDITEGMSLKVLKVKKISKNVKILLVKLPTGITTWILRT